MAPFTLQTGLKNPGNRNLTLVHFQVKYKGKSCVMPVTIEVIELDLQQWYLCLNERFRYCCGKDNNGKTSVTAEHFLDEVHSSGLKYSIGEPDQFLPNCPPSEIKSSEVIIFKKR